MRFIKLLVISGIAFFVIMVGLSALFPSHLRLSRAIDIHTTIPQQVFDTINDVRTWQFWNSFIINAPLTHIATSAKTIGTGAYISSDQLTITITNSDPDSVEVLYAQSTGRRFTGGYHIFHLRDGITTVQWYFDFQFRWYPWEKLSSMLYEKQLGTVMEESMTKLQRLIEKSK